MGWQQQKQRLTEIIRTALTPFKYRKQLTLRADRAVRKSTNWNKNKWRFTFYVSTSSGVLGPRFLFGVLRDETFTQNKKIEFIWPPSAELTNTLRSKPLEPISTSWDRLLAFVDAIFEDMHALPETICQSKEREQKQIRLNINLSFFPSSLVYILHTYIYSITVKDVFLSSEHMTIAKERANNSECEKIFSKNSYACH